ncbi:BppU family phage baseplate upper protein [Ruminiclostridium cellobioparum]|uniref:BppU family phage baseplate upper protein n=1 Tax=Ruminiclostridium cellobioparum TaxID=29355 RepID=UPI00068815E2|nr:BppU family phage baseplate upper protein [Ruminiclostridium cellobioparum]
MPAFSIMLPSSVSMYHTITITNDDQPITLQEYTCKIILQRPDNVLVKSIPSIQGNKLIYDVGTTELQISGIVKASIEVFCGLERMTVKLFSFVAVPTIDNGLKIDSITQYPDIDKNYIHTQLVPAAEWLIKHNLKKFCSVIIVDSLDNVVIGDITYIDQDKDLSERTILHHHALISSILGKAVKWGYIPGNPAAKAEVSRPKNTEMPFLEIDEVKLVMDALGKEKLKFRAIALLIYSLECAEGSLWGLNGQILIMKPAQ